MKSKLICLSMAILIGSIYSQQGQKNEIDFDWSTY